MSLHIGPPRAASSQGCLLASFERINAKSQSIWVTTVGPDPPQDTLMYSDGHLIGCLQSTWRGLLIQIEPPNLFKQFVLKFHWPSGGQEGLDESLMASCNLNSSKPRTMWTHISSNAMHFYWLKILKTLHLAFHVLGENVLDLLGTCFRTFSGSMCFSRYVCRTR